jgi:hypothetical protein
VFGACLVRVWCLFGACLVLVAQVAPSFGVS